MLGGGLSRRSRLRVVWPSGSGWEDEGSEPGFGRGYWEWERHSRECLWVGLAFKIRVPWYRPTSAQAAAQSRPAGQPDDTCCFSSWPLRCNDCRGSRGRRTSISSPPLRARAGRQGNHGGGPGKWRHWVTPSARARLAARRRACGWAEYEVCSVCVPTSSRGRELLAFLPKWLSFPG